MAANPTSLNTGAGQNANPVTAQKSGRRRTFDPVSNLDELRVPKELIEAAKVQIDAVGNDVTQPSYKDMSMESMAKQQALRRAGFGPDGEPDVRRSADIAFPLQAIGYAAIALVCRVRHFSAWLFRLAGVGLAIFSPAWCPPALTAFLAHVGALVAQLPADASAYASDNSGAAWQVARALGHDLAFGAVALFAVWTVAAMRREKPIASGIPGGRRGYRAVVTGRGAFANDTPSKFLGETRITWIGLLMGGAIEAAVFYVATPFVWSLF
ncbi:hypothetical protein BX589_101123 [Paraburkholderia fungorum]|uniref:hypothetical protein n=1 Tax=Paraburkholderia fungorum TaxID=134537 RepID=UPI000D050999|nr:hypothetical protein [Paraburkholderia fungorum]PRZ56473.1 hypothetical protein BX589_101123 [Paraburkholderia fungorum]